MQKIRSILFLLVVVATLLSACSAQPTQAPPTAAPTRVERPSGSLLTSQELPETEAGVPRVTLEVAKAALDSGAAVLVDVRSPNAFEASHIAGAVSVPLGQIERDLTQVPLAQGQWIITYCT